MSDFLDRLFGRREPMLGEASPRDAATIATLHGASFQRGWSEDEVENLLVERNVRAHRAVFGTKLVAFILSRLAADEAEILSVAVAQSARGRGLAGKLLHFHLRTLAGVGIRTVFLEVGEDNTAALRLYGRAGFREVGRRQGYYRDPGGSSAAALVLRCDLG
jgi:[ribosomal protein S18]-alanine N-acetyltransferase